MCDESSFLTGGSKPPLHSNNVASMQKALKTQKMGKAKAFWAGADFDFSQKALITLKLGKAKAF